MKVYLASWYASRDEIKQRAEELRAAGIVVTSRWLDESNNPNSAIKDNSDDYLRETAVVDIEDVLLANVVVLRVPSATELVEANLPIATWARGGRHFEAGFQYATVLFYHFMPQFIKTIGSRSLILVGHQENVFHYLDGINKHLKVFGMDPPEIPCFETWEAARTYLIEQSKTLTLAAGR